jgi:hypothetical protein
LCASPCPSLLLSPSLPPPLLLSLSLIKQALPLESHLQSILLWLFSRWGPRSYLHRAGLKPQSSGPQPPK